MMTDKMTYRWLWSCLIAGGLLLMMGCADHFEEVPQPSPMPQPEEGSKLELRAITRSIGAYKIPDAENPATSVKLFLYTLTPTDENPLKYTAVEGTFSYDTSLNRWSSTSAPTVKEETEYYMYGYMPKSANGSVSATSLSGDYSKGIDLTFTGLPAITSDDISVLVGVQRVSSTMTSSTATVNEGQYGFRSGIKGENFLNLLMAHLYARVKLSFKIDPDYAELRSIHIKNVTLTSKYEDGASVTVKLRDGKGIGNPTFPAGSEGTDEHTVTLLKTTDTEKVLDKSLGNTALPLDIPAYCRPITAKSEGQSYYLTLTTTYDVYDTGTPKQNLGERTSINRIKLNIAAISPGLEKTVVLTVKPTYLYILSDNDTPTLMVN